MRWLTVALLLLVHASAIAQDALPDLDTPLRTGLRAMDDFAVVVGVEDYAILPDVPHARRDATVMADLMRYTRGIPASRLIELVNPSRARLLASLQEAGERTGPDGRVWIYFAGHGAAHPDRGGAPMIMPRETPDDVLGFVSSGVVIEDAIALAKAGGAEVLVITDACYTGTNRTGERVLDQGGRMFVPSVWQESSPAAVWLAAGPSEVALPLDEVRHGAFTYAMIGALRGWADGEITGEPDGVVTAEEAQAYVSRALRQLGVENQRPLLKGATDELALMGSPGLSLERAPDLRLPQPSVVDAPDPQVAPTLPPSRFEPEGGFVDAAALIREQQCEEEAREAAILAQEQSAQADRDRIRAKARDAWSRLAPQLEACVDQGSPAVAAACRDNLDAFLRGAEGAKVTVPAQVFEVQTRCGLRQRAVAERSFPVDIPEASRASAARDRLTDPRERLGSLVTGVHERRNGSDDPPDLRPRLSFAWLMEDATDLPRVATRGARSAPMDAVMGSLGLNQLAALMDATQRQNPSIVSAAGRRSLVQGLNAWSRELDAFAARVGDCARVQGHTLACGDEVAVHASSRRDLARAESALLDVVNQTRGAARDDARYLASLARFALGNHAGSLELIEPVVRGAQASDEARLLHAELLFAMNRNDDAARAFAELRQAPLDHLRLFARTREAWCAFRTGEVEAAMNHLYAVVREGARFGQEGLEDPLMKAAIFDLRNLGGAHRGADAVRAQLGRLGVR